MEKYSKLKALTMGSWHSKRLGKEIISEMDRASNFIDEEIALKFALYSDDVAHNGYAFQAHLIESKVLGSVVERAELARSSYEKIRAAWKDSVEPFPINFKKWNWKEMSKFVGMAGEYDFIYFYTSRLLHVSPHSLTTDQKKPRGPGSPDVFEIRRTTN